MSSFHRKVAGGDGWGDIFRRRCESIYPSELKFEEIPLNGY
jgi:hypothetical protein